MLSIMSTSRRKAASRSIAAAEMALAGSWAGGGLSVGGGAPVLEGVGCNRSLARGSDAAGVGKARGGAVGVLTMV